MKCLYRIYDNPYKENYIGEIIFVSHERCLIVYAEELLRPDFVGKTQTECVDEIMSNYKSYYFEG
jgi:hypothetical protein